MYLLLLMIALHLKWLISLFLISVIHIFWAYHLSGVKRVLDKGVLIFYALRSILRVEFSFNPFILYLFAFVSYRSSLMIRSFLILYLTNLIRWCDNYILRLKYNSLNSHFIRKGLVFLCCVNFQLSCFITIICIYFTLLLYTRRGRRRLLMHLLLLLRLLLLLLLQWLVPLLLLQLRLLNLKFLLSYSWLNFILLAYRKKCYLKNCVYNFYLDQSLIIFITSLYTITHLRHPFSRQQYTHYPHTLTYSLYFILTYLSHAISYILL